MVASANAAALAARIAAAGLSASECESKASLFANALAALPVRGRDARLWWVPGRIEFLGKHTDYCGGPSLVCAIERGFAVASCARTDPGLRIIDACSGETADGSLDEELTPPLAHWSNYPFVVARRITRNSRGPLRGIDIAFASDLPPAAGLSSSSALVVATFLALSQANDLERHDEYRDAIGSLEDLAGYLGAVENGSDFRGLAGDRGVGTEGGSQDHTAILCASPGALAQYRFVPVHLERRMALPNDHAFVVAASGVTAAKTGSVMELYNRASRRAAEAFATLRAATGSSAPSLAALLSELPNGLADATRALRGHPDLLLRVAHLHSETRLVRAAGDALAIGDLRVMGAVVDASQSTAERLLGNQIPETIALARTARELGAVAASAFGAGFGGSVYALVEAGGAEGFRQRWAEAYGVAFPNRLPGASFFITRAGPPATSL